MLKYITSSTYRKHYSALQKLNMLTDSLKIEPYDLSMYVLDKAPKNVRQSSNPKSKSPVKNKQKENQDQQRHFASVIEDLEVYKHQTITPIKIFKSLVLAHCCFLLIRSEPSTDNTEKLNDYFKWASQQSEKMLEKFSEKETKKRSNSIKKENSIKSSKDVFSDKTSYLQLEIQSKCSQKHRSPSIESKTSSKSRSSYQAQQVLTKQMCLLSSIILPYILYLQRILSIYGHYQCLLHSIPSTLQTSAESTWTILNLFKLLSPIIKSFNQIGRYFYQDYSPIVYLLIEFISKQIIRFYPKVVSEAKRKIQLVEHEYFALQEKYSEHEIFHNHQIQLEGAQTALLLVDQIMKLNDILYHVYLGKYFNRIVQKLKIQQPKWFQIHSKQCEFIVHYNQMKNRKSRKRLSTQTSQKLIKQQQHNIPTSSSSISNCSNTTKQKDVSQRSQIVIDKKNIIPKVKNSLKLTGEKENKEKQDTITFRVKDFNNSNLDQSKNMGDETFGLPKKIQEDFIPETLKSSNRNYHMQQAQSCFSSIFKTCNQ